MTGDAVVEKACPSCECIRSHPRVIWTFVWQDNYRSPMSVFKVNRNHKRRSNSVWETLFENLVNDATFGGQVKR